MVVLNAKKWLLLCRSQTPISCVKLRTSSQIAIGASWIITTNQCVNCYFDFIADLQSDLTIKNAAYKILLPLLKVRCASFVCKFISIYVIYFRQHLFIVLRRMCLPLASLTYSTTELCNYQDDDRLSTFETHRDL